MCQWHPNSFLNKFLYRYNISNQGWFHLRKIIDHILSLYLSSLVHLPLALPLSFPHYFISLSPTLHPPALP